MVDTTRWRWKRQHHSLDVCPLSLMNSTHLKKGERLGDWLLLNYEYRIPTTLNHMNEKVHSFVRNYGWMNKQPYIMETTNRHHTQLLMLPKTVAPLSPVWSHCCQYSTTIQCNRKRVEMYWMWKRKREPPIRTLSFRHCVRVKVSPTGFVSKNRWDLWRFNGSHWFTWSVSTTQL